jgi:hypothetical protein
MAGAAAGAAAAGAGGYAPAPSGEDAAGAKGGSMKGTRACRFWQSGQCRKGDKCDFAHPGEAGAGAAGGTPTAKRDGEGGGGGDAGGAAAAASSPGENRAAGREKTVPCRFFMRGHCKSGNRCTFAHERINKSKPDKGGENKKKQQQNNNSGGAVQVESR